MNDVGKQEMNFEKTREGMSPASREGESICPDLDPHFSLLSLSLSPKLRQIPNCSQSLIE